MIRISYLCLGWLMLLLGIVGAFLPVMPTTIFLILAAWFFARSSPRLEAALLEHPRFGPTLIAWNKTGAIPKRGKFAACFGMSAGFAIFFIAVHPEPVLATAVAAVMFASAVYVLTRPTAAVHLLH